MPGAVKQDMGDVIQHWVGCGGAVGTVGVGEGRVSGLGEAVEHRSRAGPAQEQTGSGDLLEWGCSALEWRKGARPGEGLHRVMGQSVEWRGGGVPTG